LQGYSVRDERSGCPVNVGAELTVSERSAGGIRFEGFREFDRTALSEAAE
jgi:hypothetical protein